MKIKLEFAGANYTSGVFRGRFRGEDDCNRNDD